MVELAPVRAWHPDPARHRDGETMCPVYDTLSPEELLRYQSLADNAAHFVPRPHDLNLPEFLVRSKEHLARSIESGAYIQDPEPSLYVYGIQYRPAPDIAETVPESERREEYLLLGLVGALDFDHLAHGQVALHEHTFSDRVDERVALTDATGMSFAPIVAGYDDPAHHLNSRLESILGLDRRKLEFRGSRAPVAEGRLDGALHRLWRISSAELLQELAGITEPMRLLVLDGHHRFTAAAKRHYAGRRSAPLVMIVDGHDRALHVLPWHRFLPSVHGPGERLLAAARQVPEFAVRPIGPSAPSAAIGALHEMIAAGRRGFLIATGPALFEAKCPDSTDVGADFDLLHAFLEDGLGIDPHDLEFYRSPRRVLERLGEDPSGTALLLPGLTERGIEERVFHGGDVMAHKSTMFLPKVAEGLIFAPADGGSSSD